MNREELNKEFNDNKTGARKPVKPLRKLSRIDQKTKIIPEYQGLHESPSIDISIGDEDKNRRPEQQTYYGKHEKGSEKQLYNQDIPKKKSSKKDVLVKITSVVLSIAAIITLCLNMPILWYKKSGQPDERVSILTYFKRWQPTIDIEGELDEPTIELNVDTEIVNEDFTDGLDLPQLIEGQYTVLFLGFDEELENTDVIWICQFDIAGGKLHILQVPRDCSMIYYTSNPTT